MRNPFKAAFAAYDVQRKLKRMVRKERSTLRGLVAQEALKASDIKRFFLDLDQKGCYGRIKRELITAPQSHRLFDRHYEEIERIRKAWIEEKGWSPKFRNDLKTDLLQFALRETGRQIARDVFLDRQIEQHQEEILKREQELEALRSRWKEGRERDI